MRYIRAAYFRGESEGSSNERDSVLCLINRSVLKSSAPESNRYYYDRASIVGSEQIWIKLGEP